MIYDTKKEGPAQYLLWHKRVLELKIANVFTLSRFELYSVIISFYANICFIAFFLDFDFGLDHVPIIVLLLTCYIQIYVAILV